MKPVAERVTFNEVAEASIARVLSAEREAREAVTRARLEVDQIAESARAAARATTERTERRVRAITAAFEREIAVRLAEIAAEAARLDSPQPLSPAEITALQRAVEALGRELIGMTP